MQQNIPSESKILQEITSSLLPNTNLPLEVICLILSKLPIEHLERLWVFNNDWFIVTRALCLDFYRNAFQESTLWGYLPLDVRVENIPLLPYFGQFLDKSWATKFPPEDCMNLEKLLVSQGMVSAALDDLLVGIDRTILFEEEKYLIQQRQLTNSETITDFLANPPSNWLKMAKAYRHIETTLNLLLLSLFIFTDRTLSAESIFLILNRRLTYWLTGSGLDELNRHALQKKLLLSYLIDFALGEGDLFLKCPPEKRPIYQQNAKELLYRLTDDNCRALLGSQRLVLVRAIKRRCFPIIDSLGPEALRRAIEENTDDEMLLVLLERLGAARVSRALVSRSSKSFSKIVNECRKFMLQLLGALTLEQICDMIKQLIKEKFICLLDSQVFLAFFKELDARQKALMIGNTPFRQIAITCSPSKLLLHFFKTKPNYKNEIISSQLAEYLNPREILVFLEEEGTPFWNSFPQSKLLQKFTQVNDFIELYLKYDDYCKRRRFYNPVKFPEEIYLKWVAVGKKKIRIPNPDPLDLIYWDIFLEEKKGNIFYKTTSLNCEKLEQAKQACISGVHVKILERINHFWKQKKQAEEMPAKVISSWSSKQARDILVLLREENKEVWDLFPKSNLLDKFTKINDFIELYLMYNDNLEVQFPKEITLKCGQYIREKILVPNPDPLDFLYWKIFNSAYWDKLSLQELKLATLENYGVLHPKLYQEANRLWVKKLSEISEKSSTDVPQETNEKFIAQTSINDSDVPEAAHIPTSNEDLKKPISISPEVPQIPEPTIPSKGTVPLLVETPQQLIPIIKTFSIDVTPISEQSNDLTSLKEPTAVAETQLPHKTQRTSAHPIPTQQLNSTLSQDNTSINIALCIAKGLFVGLLVMGATILLLMFINYEPNVLLVDTIISDAITGGIAGAFAWVVATACFLADANICATSNTNGTNREDNPPHQYSPIQNAQTAHCASPLNCNQPFFADEVLDTSIPLIQQTSKTPFLGNGFNTEPQ